MNSQTECRRHAPSKDGWPVVNYDDSCGDYEADWTDARRVRSQHMVELSLEYIPRCAYCKHSCISLTQYFEVNVSINKDDMDRMKEHIDAKPLIMTWGGKEYMRQNLPDTPYKKP